MPLQPGAVLDNGKFLVETALGRGGFGYVYRAREQLTGETVAIKELVPALVGDPQIVQRFIQEARATLRLTHPNIARTHNVFRDGDTYYLVMEYLPGGSLGDRLRRGPVPASEAVQIIAELCAALEYAHRQGVVHCDLKPANVLFGADGAARLADFGVAHVSEQLMTRHVFTDTGTAMGTVRYMSPEQLEGVRNDPRVDIYALGAMLYEMLSGRPYLDFETETTPAAQMRNIQRIQTQPPRPLRLANPAVPDWLVEVVERALRKDPTMRFQTATALREALQAQGLEAAPVHAAGVAPRMAEPSSVRWTVPPAPKQVRRAAPRWQWAVLAAAAVLLVVMVVGLVVLLLGPDTGGSLEADKPTQFATLVSSRTRTPTPAVTPIPTSGSEPATPVVPTFTPILSPEPATPTPFVPTATATVPARPDPERERALLSQVRWRTNNGTPIFVYYAAQPPVLDGVLDEWTGTAYAAERPIFKPENWQGPADVSGSFYLAWDRDFLYLGLTVHDDRHVQQSTGKNLFNGDDVELQVDANLSGDFNDKNLSPDDGQLGIGVKDLTTGAYEAYLWRPPALEGPLHVSAAVRPAPDGYVLEVAWPWKALNWSPRTETPFGFCLSLSDDDTPGARTQETMVSTCPNRKFPDPTTWGTLILVDW
jgi:serine/threonine protein kinase